MKIKILFRAKATTGEWVFGNYIYNFHNERLINEHQINDSITGITHDIILETVGQFTGLNDKNGIEIYEGDLFIDSLGNKAIVEWDSNNARYLGWCIKKHIKYILYIGREPLVKIIGNIHDNKDLI